MGKDPRFSVRDNAILGLGGYSENMRAYLASVHGWSAPSSQQSIQENVRVSRLDWSRELLTAVFGTQK
jgi:allophanate hydrolase subunit 2